MTKTTDKDRLLEAALPNVAFDGWSSLLLENARRRCTLGNDDLAEIFPGGIRDVICHFSTWTDQKTQKTLDKKKISDLRVRDRIALCVMTRLDILDPHKQAVSLALSFMARPDRQPTMARSVWRTADLFWQMAGDTSTDYNRYTKRLLLSGVLTTRTLYWLNDSSAGNEDTRGFLDRRIENIMTVGKRLSAFTGKSAA